MQTVSDLIKNNVFFLFCLKKMTKRETIDIYRHGKMLKCVPSIHTDVLMMTH